METILKTLIVLILSSGGSFSLPDGWVPYAQALQYEMLRQPEQHQQELEVLETWLAPYIHDGPEIQEGGEMDWNSVYYPRKELPYGGSSTGTSFDRTCLAFSMPQGAFSSGSWRIPVKGPVSAGTWQYPGGGLHLGLDIAAGMNTPVYAPADGVVLYANAQEDPNGGYLGNWCGWPNGGGNTLCLLCSVNDQVYAVSFFHLSSVTVRPSQAVSQNDIIAYSGNSGNSTGPHVHIEVLAMHQNMEESAAWFSQSADFSFGTGWSQPQTCSEKACRLRPEEIFLQGES